MQSEQIEETLWTALRMFEERQNLMATMGTQRGGQSSKAMSERSSAAQLHIYRLRAMLKANDGSADGTGRGANSDTG